MSRTRSLFVPALMPILILVSAVACAPRLPSFVDASGANVTLASPAARIVSLSPAVTEILFASGAGPRVVGVTTWCNYPPEAASLPKVGEFSPDTVNMEAIIALTPDLVVGETTVHAGMAGRFARAGFRLLVLKLDSVDDIYAALRATAALSGNAASGEAAAASMKKRIDAVADKAAKIPSDRKPVVFYEVWDDPLMTAGPRTVIGMLIEMAGGRNCFPELTQDWPVVSAEQLIERNPSVFMSAKDHADKVVTEQLASRPGWSSVDAIISGRIYLLDSDIVSRPGPRIADALEGMAELLHPEIFPASK
ncbi:MAG: helical backbone metal receptor [Spirochaetes bacterium]|nr:helical backbone metal receptor [Spirochaetota bacterium]